MFAQVTSSLKDASLFYLSQLEGRLEIGEAALLQARSVPDRQPHPPRRSFSLDEIRRGGVFFSLPPPPIRSLR